MTDAFGGHGGIAQYNRDFLTALSGIEEVSDIVVLPRLAAEKNFRVPEKITQLKPVFHPVIYGFRALWLALTRGPFDLIFCGHVYMSFLAGIVSGITGKPYWLQIYGIEAWQRQKRLNVYFSERASQILSISRFSRRKFLSWATLDPERVKILPATADMSRFVPGAKSKLLLQRWGLEGCQVILTVSRLDSSERYKGHSLIIKTMPSLIKKFKKLRYVISGNGNDKKCLEQLASQLGVEKEVIFLGEVDEALKPELYRLADVFVMPSKKEGFGIVYLEAMASGIPVIAGNKDGSVDPLRDGENGRLVNPDDPREIVAAIEDQLSGAKNETIATSKFAFCNFKNHLLRILKLNFPERFACNEKLYA